MRKSTLLTVVLIACFAGFPAFGQDWTPVDNPWEFVSVLDSSDWPQYNAVDNSGRIWYGDYYAPGKVIDADGSLVAVIDSFVVPHPAGGDTTIPFLYTRGMAATASGNILFIKWGALLEIDPSSVTTTTDTVYATGVNFCPLLDGTGVEYSPIGPALDAGGYIYVGYVVGASPIEVIDPVDFVVVQEIELADAPSYARGMAVWGDAKTITTSDLETGGPLKLWTSTDLVTYTFTDSVFEDVNGDTIFQDQRVCMHWGPDSMLWVSVDDYVAPTDSMHNNITVLNFATKEYFRVYRAGYADTLSGDYGEGFRGVAFSQDGSLAYTCGPNSDGGVRGAVFVYQDITHKVDERSPGLPEGYKLAQNYPNPFNPTTRIAYEIPETELVSLAIYNLLGQKVRTLVNEVVTAGEHTAIWDARADNGMPVASGTYFCKLSTSSGSITKTMVFIK